MYYYYYLYFTNKIKELYYDLYYNIFYKYKLITF